VPSELVCLKKQIDDVDEHILNLLVSRFRFAALAASHKSLDGIPPRIPARIQALIESRENSGRGLGLPEGAVHNIWTAIIEETCRFEEQVISGLPAPRDAETFAKTNACEATSLAQHNSD
jgi:isochorismate pyruvate lyase